MGFIFRRRIRIAPGVYINVSKSGFSVSIGGGKIVRGTVNLSTRGIRPTVSAPGTGSSWRGGTVKWSDVLDFFDLDTDETHDKSKTQPNGVRNLGHKSEASATTSTPTLDSPSVTPQANEIDFNKKPQDGYSSRLETSQLTCNVFIELGTLLSKQSFVIGDKSQLFPESMGKPLTVCLFDLEQFGLLIARVVATKRKGTLIQLKLRTENRLFKGKVVYRDLSSLESLVNKMVLTAGHSPSPSDPHCQSEQLEAIVDRDFTKWETLSNSRYLEKVKEASHKPYGLLIAFGKCLLLVTLLATLTYALWSYSR